jgi:DNA-binding FrmR family transcriptional regulator
MNKDIISQIETTSKLLEELSSSIIEDNIAIINSIDCFIDHYEDYDKQTTMVWLRAIKSQLNRINERLEE